MKRFLRHFGEDGILRRDIGVLLQEYKQMREDNKVLSRIREKSRYYECQRHSEKLNTHEDEKIDPCADHNPGFEVNYTRDVVSEVEFHYTVRQWIVHSWGRADFPLVAKKIIDGEIHTDGQINNELKHEIKFLCWLFVNNVKTLCKTYKNDDCEETTTPQCYQFDDVGILDVDNQKRQTRMKYIL